MLFIEPPALRDRDPVLIQFVEHHVERLDSTFQVGGIGMPEQETLLAEQLPGPGRFGNAFLAQIDIRPSR